MGPDDELASLIAERLVEAGLVDEDRRHDASARVATGAETPEDWRFWIEVGPAVDAGATVHAQD